MASQDWEEMVEQAVETKYWADYATEGVSPKDFKGWQWVCDLSGVTLTPGDLMYDPITPTVQPQTLAYGRWTNETEVEDTQTLTVSKTTTASFSWSVTETIKIKSAQKVSCGLPGIAGGSIDLSEELDVGSAQTTTATQQQSWNESYEVPIPPQSTVVTQVSIQSASYTTPFQVTFSFSGTIIAGMVQGDAKATNTYDVSDVLSPDQLNQTASGTFTGVQGIDYSVTTNQYPPGGGPTESELDANLVE